MTQKTKRFQNHLLDMKSYTYSIFNLHLIISNNIRVLHFIQVLYRYVLYDILGGP